jgi:hypothetical protein
MAKLRHQAAPRLKTVFAHFSRLTIIFLDRSESCDTIALHASPTCIHMPVDLDFFYVGCGDGSVQVRLEKKGVPSARFWEKARVCVRIRLCLWQFCMPIEVKSTWDGM